MIIIEALEIIEECNIVSWYKERVARR